MTTEIKYQGLSTAPSDYQCQDGELHLPLNIVNEDGALRPLLPGAHMFNIRQGSLCSLHHVPTGDHCIFSVTRPDRSIDLHWMPMPGSFPAPDFMPSADNSFGNVPDIRDLKIIGNVIAVATSQGIRYFLWHNDRYTDLGNRPPRLDVRIDTHTVPYDSDSNADGISDSDKLRFDKDNIIEGSDIISVYNNNSSLTLGDENKKKFCDILFAEVNAFIAYLNKQGKFCFPFFLRFCYRLFDGSCFMHTSPQLVIPNSYCAPVVILRGYKKGANANVLLPATEVSLKLPPFPEHWKSIVTSVEVLMSKPLVSYSPEDKCFINATKPSEADRAAFALGIQGDDRLFVAKELANYADNSTRADVPDSDFYTKEYVLNKTYGEPNITKQPNFQYLYAHTFGVHKHFTPWYGKKVYCKRIEAAEAPEKLNLNDEYTIYDIRDIPDGTIIFTREGATDLYNDPGQSGQAAHFYIVAVKTQDDTAKETPHLIAHFERADKKPISEVVRDNAEFYLVKSIPIDDLSADKADSEGLISFPLDFGKTAFNNLYTQESVAEDYRSNDTYIPKLLNVYNSRLSMAPDAVSLFNGHSFHNVFSPDNPSEIPTASNVSQLLIEVAENSTSNILPTSSPADAALPSGSTNIRLFSTDSLLWFFYPNTNAKALYICTADGSVRKVSLAPHPFLNGAFAFNDFKPLVADATSQANAPSPSMTPVPISSMIKVSQVNNPFVFNAVGSISAGSGNVLGFAAATKALSQGQFGQFPLYVFCTDGIWSLELSADGSFNAVKPLSRDVLLSGSHPLQLDSAVIFATARGIMLLQGSDSKCISDSISASLPTGTQSLPSIAKLHEIAGVDCCQKPLSLLQFLSGSDMLFDYIHQRVIIFNHTYDYAYIFSMKSGMWSLMQSDLSYATNSYPDAMAVDKSGNLLNLSLDSGEPLPSLIVTRPLKLQAPDILKTVRTVIQRGDFARGHVASVLWASRDLRHWHLIWSSQDHYLRGFSGTPYKYFRIGLIANLDPKESISGATIEFFPRQTNQPR